MYLTTINIIGVDYKVYGLTEKEWKANKKLDQNVNGMTDSYSKKIYIEHYFFVYSEKEEHMYWDAIEHLISHEIGHAIEGEISGGSFSHNERFAEMSAIHHKMCKKYVPIIIKAWKEKEKHENE